MVFLTILLFLFYVLYYADNNSFNIIIVVFDIGNNSGRFIMED